MRVARLFLCAALPLLAAGCSKSDQGNAEAAASAEASIQAALAKLSPEDRALAEAQYWCPAMPDHRLGSMGPPIAVEAEGKKVFVCCKGCAKVASNNPAHTLKVVEKLKAYKAAGTTPDLKELAYPDADQ